MATVASKHLISPREEQKIEDSQIQIDVKNTWNNQADNVQSDSDLNKTNEESAQGATSQNNSASNKASRNQSVIRI